jgi:sepiapterin reductase
MANNPIVLVTGASRGIGASAALWLARAGADVVLTARSVDDLEQTAAAVRAEGRQAVVLAADLAQAGAGRAVVEQVLREVGWLDALVNNAGVVEPIGPVADVDQARVQQAVAVNLLAVFETSQAALPALRACQGRLINVSTGAAVSPIEGWAAYCASKAGALMFTRVVAAEEPEIIAVNYSPGVVDTAMQGAIRANQAGMAPERAAYFQRLKDEEQLQPPDAAGQVLAWLALQAPRAMSGQMVGTRDEAVQAGVRALFGER